LEGNIYGQIKIIFWQLSEGNEENQEDISTAGVFLLLKSLTCNLEMGKWLHTYIPQTCKYVTTTTVCGTIHKYTNAVYTIITL